MGFFSSLFMPSASYQPWDNFWYDPPGSTGQTVSGMPADESAAMRVSAFFNGVRILAETVAQPPLIVYERLSDSEKQSAKQHPLYNVLHNKPNSFQTSYEFRLLQTTSLLIGGNAYAEIISEGRSAVDELRPLLCGRMTPHLLSNGRVGYMYRPEKGPERAYTQDEIFHVRAFPLSEDGVCGTSILQFARETTALNLSTEAFGSRLFKGDAKRLGNYSVPGTLTPEQRTQIKTLIKADDNLVLENGATWIDRGMTAADAEFLMTRKFGVTEMARFLNIQPHLLKDLERATFANIEHQGLEFLQYTMMPYFVNWEQAILRDLITQKKRFFAEFLVDGLVRADIKTRYEAYGSGINSGFMTRNQAREKENWNRITGLDAPLVDQNKAIVDPSGKIIPINQPEPGPDIRRNENMAQRYEQLMRSGLERVMRKEASAALKAWERCGRDKDKFCEWADKFYAEHESFAADVLQLDEAKARELINARREKCKLNVMEGSHLNYFNDTAQYAATRTYQEMFKDVA